MSQFTSPTDGDIRPSALGQPSPSTLFRLRVYDQTASDLVRRAKERLTPLLQLRDQAKILKIRDARTVEDLLDLSPQATGLAKDAWHEHIRRFGKGALPPIMDALRQIYRLEDQELRQRLYILLITELRWQGAAGIQALMQCWQDLDDFAKSLGCVVIGLANWHDGSELIWAFYQTARRLPQEQAFVGALWAMLDLGDARLANELHGLLEQGAIFYELFGFLARAGQARSLGLLLDYAAERGASGGFEPWIAATGIAHRSGRAAAIESLMKYAAAEEAEVDLSEMRRQAEEAADILLSNPPQLVGDVFPLFYRGLRADDVQGVMGSLIRQ